jgi:hypothetical protein
VRDLTRAQGTNRLRNGHCAADGVIEEVDVTLFDGRNTTAPGTIFTKQSQKTK